MASGGPPEKLNNRHIAAAHLYISGLKQKDIAKALGYNENRLSIIVNSPLFQAYVRELQAEAASKVTDPVVDLNARLQQEALPSINKLAQLRDSGSEERIQLSAASRLIEHAVPKRTQIDEERRVIYEIDERTFARMQAVMAEDRGERIRPIPLEAVPAPADPYDAAEDDL